MDRIPGYNLLKERFAKKEPLVGNDFIKIDARAGGIVPNGRTLERALVNMATSKQTESPGCTIIGQQNSNGLDLHFQSARNDETGNLELTFRMSESVKRPPKVRLQDVRSELSTGGKSTVDIYPRSKELKPAPGEPLVSVIFNRKAGGGNGWQEVIIQNNAEDGSIMLSTSLRPEDTKFYGAMAADFLRVANALNNSSEAIPTPEVVQPSPIEATPATAGYEFKATSEPEYPSQIRFTRPDGTQGAILNFTTDTGMDGGNNLYRNYGVTTTLNAPSGLDLRAAVGDLKEKLHGPYIIADVVGGEPGYIIQTNPQGERFNVDVKMDQQGGLVVAASVRDLDNNIAKFAPDYLKVLSDVSQILGPAQPPLEAKLIPNK